MELNYILLPCFSFNLIQYARENVFKPNSAPIRQILSLLTNGTVEINLFVGNWSLYEEEEINKKRGRERVGKDMQ